MKPNASEISIISSNARNKIISDFFPKIAKDTEEYITSNSKDLLFHAGALCLYAALLVNKTHETNPESIKPEDNERELAIQNYYRNYSNNSLSEEEIQTKAHTMILNDIRNCFAHGNFQIYHNKQHELYFILQPTRPYLNIDTPIVISANTIKDVIMSSSFDFTFSNINSLISKITGDITSILKGTIIPIQMVELSDHYLKNTNKQPFPVPQKRYLIIQFVLLASQITYEQNDYYKIFGKNSDIFEKISLIRNSIAHDNYTFTELAKDINFTDKTRTLNNPINESVTYLYAANQLKSIIMYILDKGHSLDKVEELKDKLNDVLQLFFDNLKSTNNYTT